MMVEIFGHKFFHECPSIKYNKNKLYKNRKNKSTDLDFLGFQKLSVSWG